jgi:hypothetical protein
MRAAKSGAGTTTSAILTVLANHGPTLIVDQYTLCIQTDAQRERDVAY